MHLWCVNLQEQGRTKIYLSADCHWLKGCSRFKLVLMIQKNDSLCRKKWWWGVGHQARERHRRPGEGGWWEGSQEAQKTANHPDHSTETGLQGLLWGVLETLQKGKRTLEGFLTTVWRKFSNVWNIPWSALGVMAHGYLNSNHEPYSSFTNKILKLKKSSPPQSGALKWPAAFCSALTEAGWCNAVRLHQMSYWDRRTASIAWALKQALQPVQGFEEAKKTAAFIQRWLKSKQIKRRRACWEMWQIR